MRNTKIRKVFVMTSLLIVAGYVSKASAYDFESGLGSAAGASDVFQVDCYNNGEGNTDHLKGRVKQ